MSDIHKLRKVVVDLQETAGTLVEMLDELAAFRAKERLDATVVPLVEDDLPPDGATGLYLDRLCDIEDLEWIGMVLARRRKLFVPVSFIGRKRGST